MTKTSRTLALPGYKIGRVHSQHGDRVAFFACREHDNINVVIETLNTDYPSRRQIAEIRREGAICQRLIDVEGICSVHAMLPHGSGNLALVFDPYEMSLRGCLLKAKGNALPVKDVIDIALPLAATLGRLHKKGIVHKAITPENILINPISKKLALSGFGISSELGQEPQAAQISRQPQGELPYVSPEQTGRMNRDLDYRSDYYSLGVVLYELLTGRRPFRANSLLEWVHCHISQQPTPPHELLASIPLTLSDIVMKLMSKNPDSRYQSARGLIHDLEQINVAISQGEQCYISELGEMDNAHTFLVPQGLYGREEELNQLLALYEEAISGHTRFCLVHGFSGVGKTALVNELDKYQTRERGFVVQGKFDQYHQGDTYSTFGNTLKGLVHQILLEPEERLSDWRVKIQDALTTNAALVVNIVPELAIIIGEQPDVVELPPAEAKNRLHLVLTDFLSVFADKGHPVVLFLDDLQWCDLPTLHLLKHIVSNKEQCHLLLIGAYRSNEVSVGHPLQRMLDDLSHQTNIAQLPVQPLKKESVAELVADALSRPIDDVRPLSDELFQKALGNPFFTNELLRHLHKIGAISPDPNSDSWHFDLSSADWRSVSDNVVEFMIASLRELDQSTQNLLQLAACIGGRFDLKTLAQIYQKPIDETASALLPALQQYTIRPLHNDYRLIAESREMLDFEALYSFQHDRVQQAAYSLIEKSKLSEVHWSIGQILLQQHHKHIPADDLIDIVEHLNAGRELIVSSSEKVQLAKHNLRAGQRARSASAYEVALDYVTIAKELMDSSVSKNESEFMRLLATELQLCNYLTGRTEAADKWLQVMLEQACSNLEKSEVLAIRTRQFATLGRMQESVQSAIEGLALLGIEFPSHPDETDIAYERKLVIENLGGRSIESLVNAPEETNQETLVAMRLFMEVFAAAFLSGTGKTFPYLVLKSVNLSLRSGLCPESAFAYASYGMILCGELDEPALGYEFGKVGLAINEKLGDLKLKARVIYLYAMFVHHWSEHWSTLTPWFKKGIEAGYQTGDLLYLAYSAQDCVIWDPQLDLETAHRKHLDNLAIVRECAYQDSLDSGTLFLQLQRNLLGLTTSPTSFNDKDFDEQTCLLGMQKRGFKTGLANYHIYKAEACFLHGAYDKAMTHLQEQDKLIQSAMSLPQLVRYYLVANLTLAEQYHNMSESQQADTLDRMQKDLMRMSRWADNCEANFRHLFYLMSAEIEQVSGKLHRALDLFDKSIELAQKHGFLRDEAIASERAARLLIGSGKWRSAEGYLRGAYRIFDRWGAHRKVKQLELEFPVLRDMLSPIKNSEQGNIHADIDLASVLKASRAISGEIRLDQLLQNAIHILLENAGAQWGCLIACEQRLLKVESAILPEPALDTDEVPKHTLISLNDGSLIPAPVSLIMRVLHDNKAIVLHQAHSDGEFTQDPYIHRFQPKSVLCVPIKRARFEGVVYLENNLATGVFSQERVETIRLLAAQASVAIENARLYEQVQEHSRTLEQKVVERTEQLENLNKELQRLANHDSLTGVANRRRGDMYLEQVWTTLQREQQPLSILMIDVDHFKHFNDNYGHQNGDACLIDVTKAIQAELRRPADLIARYGGEEFILILPNTDAKGAEILGEKARRAVEALNIPHAYSPTGKTVTVSVGAATAVPVMHTTAENLVKQADNNLYEAKHSGRNKVLVSAQ
ncbi:diguanylate cyclase domain-containing protein [Aliiglaciecola sp. M165]|uniref:diguanylate cyclase domain-containing protein n=1 Tax=Aliiglaciecola sp. M165 TaxID=2593649 RepID=UPI0011805F38|nr:diguanylate cyclase [Aliiglaciecola sp. M165]TRY33200.1 diguanylate cyclase [Aliiglaciecola sp. M165]